jgi:uncharacterized protein YbjT (DUF2867 family)
MSSPNHLRVIVTGGSGKVGRYAIPAWVLKDASTDLSSLVALVVARPNKDLIAGSHK